MAKPTRKKVTIVRTHPRKVAVSPKNPAGITIVDRHPRRIHGPALGAEDIRRITESRNRNGIVYPVSDDLKFPDGNTYDELIAIWVDFFNKTFGVTPPDAPLDPDLIKALIASESEFRKAPKNPRAIGIAQITPATLKALLDPEGGSQGLYLYWHSAKRPEGSGNCNSHGDSMDIQKKALGRRKAWPNSYSG